MSVGLTSGDIWTEIGDSDLLHSFFSTICYHLEANNWGSKYPYLQKKLYYEKLNPEEISHALDELKDIQIKLASFKPENIIWDVEDLTKKPPASFYSQAKAFNLSNSFKSVNWKNIFDVFYEVLEFCKRRKISVKIQSKNDFLK